MKSIDLYKLILRPFPREFRAQFAEEMISVFQQALCDAEKDGTVSRIRLVSSELAGLARGCLREWQRLLTSRKHRPVGRICDEFVVPTSVEEAERYIELASRRVISAIANHQFASARIYDRNERRAREVLAELRMQSH